MNYMQGAIQYYPMLFIRDLQQLQGCIYNSLVTPKGYSMMCKDWTEKRGGGIAVLCRNDWKMKEIAFKWERV